MAGNGAPCMEIIPSDQGSAAGDRQHPAHTTRTASVFRLIIGHRPLITETVDWTTWWPWRGAYTRSHPELGREIPQRPWYCVLRHGRVGRRQVFQSTPWSSHRTRQSNTQHPRGVE